MEPTTNDSFDSLTHSGPTPSAPADEQAQEQDFPVNLQAFPGLSQEQVLDFCKQRNSQFATWFEPIGKIIEKMHRMYNNKPAKRVRMVYPTVYSIVETICSRLTPTLFNRSKFVEAIPEFMVQDVNPTTGAPGNKEQILNNEDFVNQNLAWYCKLPEKGKQIGKAMVLEGLSIVREVWKQETIVNSSPTFATDPLSGQQKYTGESDNELVKEHFDIEVKSLFDMAWEPRCWQHIKESEWVRERAKMSLNQLLQWEQEGRIQNVAEIEKITPGSVTSQGDDAKKDWEAERLKSIGRGEYFKKGDEKAYKVDEWYAWMAWKETLEDQTTKLHREFFHFMVVEESILVRFDRCELRPYRIPYISVPIIVNVRELIGKAIPEPIEPLYDNINIVGDRQAELVDQAADPLTFYDQRSGLNQRLAFLSKKGFVPVENASQGINRPAVNTPGIQANMQYLQFMMQMARDASAATEQAQGISGKTASDTLGEFQGLIAGAMSRFGEMIDTATVYLFPYLADACHKFYKQFGKDGQMFVLESTSDGKSIAITRQDLQGDYIWVPITVNKHADEQQTIEADDNFLFEMLKIGPVDIDGKKFDVGKWITDRIMANRKIKGREYLKISPPPPPPTPPPPPPVLAAPGQEWYIPPAPGTPQAGPIMPPGQPLAPGGPAMPPGPPPIPAGGMGSPALPPSGVLPPGVEHTLNPPPALGV